MKRGSLTVSSGNSSEFPEASAGIRFVSGCVLTTAAVTVSAATAFWLGNNMLQLLPGNFLGMMLSVWLGTIILFTLNFFQPRLERAIVRDFEEMNSH